MQVAAQAVGRRGRVVGVDLAEIDPPLPYNNVIALSGDFTQPEVIQEILSVLGGRANVLLSDAAPKLTGIRSTDHAREGTLLEGVEALLPELLAPRGTLLVKILEGPEASIVDRRLRSRFKTAKTVHPKATRRGSAERYLVGKDYQGAPEYSDPPK